MRSIDDPFSIIGDILPGHYIGLALIIIAAYSLYRLYRFFHSVSNKKILKLYGLDTGIYKVVGTDLGGSKKKPTVIALGLIGCPDALFRRRTESNVFHVGEYKSRKYKGYVKDYEYYQVILYMGIIYRMYNAKHVDASIRYADKLIAIKYDDDVFNRLLGLKDELQRVSTSWRVVDPRPLKKR